MKGSPATQAEGQSETYVDGLGRKAGTVYFDRLGHRRVVTPPEHYDDNGNLVATGAKATATRDAHLDEAQEHNRQALAQLKPHELARFETWLRTRTHAAPPVRPPSSPASSGLVNGRAPREARNDRRRGSRRGERATSSSSDDPEPPSAARPCACGCGQSRKPGDNHYNDECRKRHARERKRQQRARDRARDATERPGVDRHRRDPYLALDPAELEALRERVKAGCRCNGHHILDAAGGDDDCIKCGHQRGGLAPFSGRTFIQARSAETRRVRKAAA